MGNEYETRVLEFVNVSLDDLPALVKSADPDRQAEGLALRLAARQVLRVINEHLPVEETA